jgi:hypothetical protein
MLRGSRSDPHSHANIRGCRTPAHPDQLPMLPFPAHVTSRTTRLIARAYAKLSDHRLHACIVGRCVYAPGSWHTRAYHIMVHDSVTDVVRVLWRRDLVYMDTNVSSFL